MSHRWWVPAFFIIANFLPANLLAVPGQPTALSGMVQTAAAFQVPARRDKAVELFNQKNYRGLRELIRADDTDLGNNAIGNDRLRSLKLPPNCTVTLFEHKGFRGRSEVLRASDPDLSDNGIGLDQASSIRVAWGDPPERRRLNDGGQVAPIGSGKVTVYAGKNFRGASQVFDGDVLNLERSGFGYGRMGSIRIPSGFEVTLYESPGFGGRSTVLRTSVADLKSASRSLSRISSMRMTRKGSSKPTIGRVLGGETNRVTVFSGKNFGGDSEAFEDEVTHFGRTKFGNDRMRSIKIPNGYQVTLYANSWFHGKSVVLSRSEADLSRTSLGLDSVSSMKVNKQQDAPVTPERKPVRRLSNSVVIYSAINFQGDAEVVEGDVAHLSRTKIGNDRMRSIHIPQGYRVTLYQNSRFAGRKVVLDRSESDLSRTSLGLDSVSSLKLSRANDDFTPVRRPPVVNPPGSEHRGEVVLFSRKGYAGKEVAIADNVRNLRTHEFGNDRLQSIKIPPRCTVTLYEHSRYRGRSEVFRQSDADLSDNPIGLNNASSVRVVWDEPGSGENYRRPAELILFSQKNFSGKRGTVSDDMPRLSFHEVGNDRLQSLRVPPSCKVTLYEHDGFRGRSEVFFYDDPDLSDNPIGLNRASSVKITWLKNEEHPRAGEGVVVFEDQDYEGNYEVLFNSDPDLRDNSIGQDRISSMHVPPGCTVNVYRDINYRGVASSFKGDIANFKSDLVGNDRISSIKIMWDPGYGPGGEEGISLYQDTGFRGRVEIVFRDIPDMRSSSLGNDQLSSLRVPAGYRVTLYEHVDFRGRSEVFDGDDRDLRNNTIGNDRVSSIRIEWVGH